MLKQNLLRVEGLQITGQKPGLMRIRLRRTLSRTQDQDQDPARLRFMRTWNAHGGELRTSLKGAGQQVPDR